MTTFKQRITQLFELQKQRREEMKAQIDQDMMHDVNYILENWSKVVNWNDDEFRFFSELECDIKSVPKSVLTYAQKKYGLTPVIFKELAETEADFEEAEILQNSITLLTKTFVINPLDDSIEQLKAYIDSITE